MCCPRRSELTQVLPDDADPLPIDVWHSTDRSCPGFGAAGERADPYGKSGVVPVM